MMLLKMSVYLSETLPMLQLASCCWLKVHVIPARIMPKSQLIKNTKKQLFNSRVKKKVVLWKLLAQVMKGAISIYNNKTQLFNSQMKKKVLLWKLLAQVVKMAMSKKGRAKEGDEEGQEQGLGALDEGIREGGETLRHHVPSLRQLLPTKSGESAINRISHLRFLKCPPLSMPNIAVSPLPIFSMQCWMHPPPRNGTVGTVLFPSFKKCSTFPEDPNILFAKYF